MLKMLSNSIPFVSNNVKGIQSLEENKKFWIFKKGYRLLWVYFSTGDTIHHA